MFSPTRDGAAPTGDLSAWTAACWTAVAVFLVCLPGAAGVARAYTPESPEVKQMVRRAVAYLEREKEDRKLGGECLYALALHKTSDEALHPRVERTVKRCASLAESSLRSQTDVDNYSLSLAIILLCDVNPLENRALIITLVNELLRRQRPGGAWTYDTTELGDTSQTQYAVLALWAVQHVGIEVPPGPLVRVANWLLRTQTPEGAWGYHPRDPGDFRRGPQHDVRHSLVAAGVGSLYVCANVLDLPAVSSPRLGERGGLPAVFVPVSKRERSEKAEFLALDAAMLHDAQRDANLWLQNNFEIAPKKYTLYYLYGLERYFSFREAAEGLAPAEPEWYNAGVEWLAETQGRDGAWIGRGTSSGYDTAFAVLFLIRSTKRALGAPAEGVLRGGIGLPTNAEDVDVAGARLVARESARQLQDALALLADDRVAAEAAEPNAMDGAAGRVPHSRLVWLTRFGSATQRLAAVRVLAAQRNLDDVPLLIDALADDDEHIVIAARDGLRFVSRKLQGFGLEASADADQRRGAQAKWRAWYRLVRPNAEFWKP